MNLTVLLSIAAAYMALVGIGMLFVPQQFGVGAVPADASPALIADQQLFDQELLLARARGAQLNAVVQLYRALGGGWQ